MPMPAIAAKFSADLPFSTQHAFLENRHDKNLERSNSQLLPQAFVRQTSCGQSNARQKKHILEHAMAERDRTVKVFVSDIFLITAT